MKIKFILLLFFVFNSFLLAEKQYETFTLKKENIVKIYDGDTFFCNIPNVPDLFGKNIGVRIAGIDTPELRSKNIKETILAVKAKSYLYGLIANANIIELKNTRRDKYFRILADVYVDGKNVSEIMIKEKLAYAYFGGKKKLGYFNETRRT
jgi:micrococcal nuclease